MKISVIINPQIDSRPPKELAPVKTPGCLKSRLGKASHGGTAKTSIRNARFGPDIDQVNEDDKRVQIDNTLEEQRNNLFCNASHGGTCPEAGSCTQQKALMTNIDHPQQDNLFKQIHLPDAIVGYKMDNFESLLHHLPNRSIGKQAVLSHDMLTKYNRMSIEQQNQVLQILQEKVAAIKMDVEVHFLQVQSELEANKIFNSFANYQRAQSVCLVEMQKRLQISKLLTEAIQKVTDKTGLRDKQDDQESLLCSRANTTENIKDTTYKMQFPRLEVLQVIEQLGEPSGKKENVISGHSREVKANKKEPNLHHNTRDRVEYLKSKVKTIGTIVRTFPSVWRADSSLSVGAHLQNLHASLDPSKEEVMLCHSHVANAIRLLSSNRCNVKISKLSKRTEFASDEANESEMKMMWTARQDLYKSVANKLMKDLFLNHQRSRQDSSNFFDSHANYTQKTQGTHKILSSTLRKRILQAKRIIVEPKNQDRKDEQTDSDNSENEMQIPEIEIPTKEKLQIEGQIYKNMQAKIFSRFAREDKKKINLDDVYQQHKHMKKFKEQENLNTDPDEINTKPMQSDNTIKTSQLNVETGASEKLPTSTYMEYTKDREATLPKTQSLPQLIRNKNLKYLSGVERAILRRLPIQENVANDNSLSECKKSQLFDYNSNFSLEQRRVAAKTWTWHPQCLPLQNNTQSDNKKE